jgi:hypothetical protein
MDMFNIAVYEINVNSFFLRVLPDVVEDFAPNFVGQVRKPFFCRPNEV